MNAFSWNLKPFNRLLQSIFRLPEICKLSIFMNPFVTATKISFFVVTTFPFIN